MIVDHAYEVSKAVSQGEVSPESLLVASTTGRCEPPESVDLGLYRVYAVHLLARHTEALAAADTLLRYSVYMTTRKKVKLHMWRGLSLWRLGQFEKSLSPLKIASRYYAGICPGDRCDYVLLANLYENLGWSLAETDRHDESACAFDKAYRTVRAAIKDSTANAYITDIYTETLRGQARLTERAGRVVLCDSDHRQEPGEWALWFVGIVGLLLCFFVLTNRKNS